MIFLVCSAGAEPRGYARCRRVRGHDWPTQCVFVSTQRSPFRSACAGQERYAGTTHTVHPMRPSRRVVVTGLGAVTPLGNSVSEFWSNVVAGKSGVGDITSFDASHLPTRFAAE